MLDVPEVLKIHVIPSDEMMIVPELPTETNNPEVVSSLLDPQLTLQVLIVRLKQEIRKTKKNFFIFYSIPKVKYYWIRRAQYIPSIGLFYKNRGRLWRVSDCEELVGEVNHTTESVTDLFSFVDVEWIIM